MPRNFTADYANPNDVKTKYLVLENFSIFAKGDTFETTLTHRAWLYRKGAKIKTGLIELKTSKLVKEIRSVANAI
jgi:hypothetical protein